MIFIPYHPRYNSALQELFYYTIHTTNAADYTPAQLDAWAPAHTPDTVWSSRLQHHYTLLALEQKETTEHLHSPMLLGFGSLRLPAPKEDIALLQSTCTTESESIHLFSRTACCALLDHLFVRPEAQGRGLGSRLSQSLEEYALGQGYCFMLTFASLTAQDFFHARGYECKLQQKVERCGQQLSNALMVKALQIPLH